ncbi:hypothetical protein GCM10007853_16960 [Algimonas ampicilliniresistens]|uniref:Uncharacterized protein n=1 Tax=Algimonas ampicilliniresistens TaxID=1298735 RepID=A0ABQ5V9X9_9PROT|nr:hypothetical protein GCM10007853_16960 [Algimonas ampicilliniresistens]
MAIMPLPLRYGRIYFRSAFIHNAAKGGGAGEGLEIVSDAAPFPIPISRRLLAARTTMFGRTLLLGFDPASLGGLFKGAHSGGRQSFARSRIFQIVGGCL